MGGGVRAEELRVGLGGTIAVREEGGRTVVSPATTEEMAAVLRLCNSSCYRVSVRGAGIKRGWGGEVEADVVLETGRLGGVREHSWQDLTATVGAGTPWAEMQRVLAAHGQMVALDPMWATRATVGGVLATNDSGAWRLKYGSARDLVIGMTLVLADGTVAKTGGKVVKNVAGYDLHKLMIGAFGTLAVITEVTFRLHPLPSHVEVVTLLSKDLEALGRLLPRILDTQMNVQALQLRATGLPMLDVAWSGPADLIATHVDALSAMAGAGVSRADSDMSVFAARERVFFDTSVSVLKVTMLPSQIAAAAAAVAAVRGKSVTQASGIMFASVATAVVERAVERLGALAKSSDGGTVSVLRGPSGPAVPDAKVFGVMREIKRRFDPERILNRGAMGGV